MRTKVTLALLFLNVVLFFFIFKFEHSWRTETSLQEARRRVLGAETANIRSLSVTSSAPGGPSYTIVRTRDVWTLTQPIDWPANQHAVRALLQALQFLENETSFSVADLAKNGYSLADYGLDKPRLTVAFASSEAGSASADSEPTALPTTVLRIGGASEIGNRLYVLSPDGTRIHVVDRSFADALSLPLEQLRADNLLTIQVFEARALVVQTSGARVRIARREGGRWMFDTIVNARAGKTQMDLTINDLNQLRAASFPAAPPSTLPATSPSLRVTLDGNGRSETLLLGEPVGGSANGAAPAEGDPAGVTEFYGQVANGSKVRAPVFTVAVSNKLLRNLRLAQTELRERRVLDFEPANVASLTIAAPNLGQASITLQRLDPGSPESVWQGLHRAPAAAGQQTFAADTAAVRRLLDRLALLSATRFEHDAPSSAQNEAWGFNRPEREITVVTNPTPGGNNRPLVLQLGTDGAGGVFARVGAPNEPGQSVYAVDVDLAADFPVHANAWRDRVISTLPAPAKITSLKLTDIVSGLVLYETRFDGEGRPETKPKTPAALEELRKSVRELRAQRFVQDSFAERVLAAGEERGWRYQLDATIALPGGIAEQVSQFSLLFTERLGGNLQLAGSKDLNLVFEVEQPLLDALWTFTYASRDPGPQAEQP